MYNPLVTIVIPVYNGSNYLAEAIDSALAQTYKNIEIIVVNDGSTDDGLSEKIAISYGDKITYYAKENGGVSSVLNFAITKMNGEWLSWLSHDDLYYPNKIEKQIEFINKLLDKNPDINLDKLVLHSATESIDKDRNVIKTPSYRGVDIEEKSIDVIIKNVYNYRLSGCSFLIPKYSFQDIGGFREDIRTVSDVEFWYRLAFNGYKFYCLKHDILVRNRNHGKQVGKVKVNLFEQELNSLYIDIAKKINENPEFATKKTLLKYYYGVSKRHITDAQKYVKEDLLKPRISKLEYSVVLPVVSSCWWFIGAGRDIVKYFFRKLKVK